MCQQGSAEVEYYKQTQVTCYIAKHSLKFEPEAIIFPNLSILIKASQKITW